MVDAYGDPLAGVPVVVNDHEGVSYQVNGTGDDGTLSVEVPPGGVSLSFRRRRHRCPSARWSDPPPGSEVRFPNEAPQKRSATDAETTTYEVSFTGIPVEAFYIWVLLDGDCGGSGASPDRPATTVTDEYCADSPTHRVIAFAHDEPGQVLAWGETMVSTNPAGAAAITVPLNQTAISSTTVEVGGIPSGASSLNMYTLAADGWLLAGAPP